MLNIMLNLRYAGSTKATSITENNNISNQTKKDLPKDDTANKKSLLTLLPLNLLMK